MVSFLLPNHSSLSQTDAEYKEIFLTYKKGKTLAKTKVFNSSHYAGNLPESVDWRTNNAVTGVKDQVCIPLQWVTLKNSSPLHEISVHTYSWFDCDVQPPQLHWEAIFQLE